MMAVDHPMPFRLQFAVADVGALASRYDIDVDDDAAAAGAAARKRGHYTKAELVLLAEWKTPRSKSRVARNTETFVERVTAAVFATSDEWERMAGLCSLRGVDVPTGSVLLHFAYPERYPIIDWRALESLGEPRRTPYAIGYWLAYAESCRQIANAASVSLRVLDKALWQYSRERSVERRQ